MVVSATIDDTVLFVPRMVLCVEHGSYRGVKGIGHTDAVHQNQHAITFETANVEPAVAIPSRGCAGSREGRARGYRACAFGALLEGKLCFTINENTSYSYCK